MRSSLVKEQVSIQTDKTHFEDMPNWLSKPFYTHLTSDVLFPEKKFTINQGVHQKLQSPELRLVKTRKKSHDWIRRY